MFSVRVRKPLREINLSDLARRWQAKKMANPLLGRSGTPQHGCGSPGSVSEQLPFQRLADGENCRRRASWQCRPTDTAREIAGPARRASSPHERVLHPRRCESSWGHSFGSSGAISLCIAHRKFRPQVTVKWGEICNCQCCWRKRRRHCRRAAMVAMPYCPFPPLSV